MPFPYTPTGSCLCVSASACLADFLLGNGHGAGAKDVSLNTKPFSTRVPFTATGLATIELGFGRNSSVVLNYFFVSQVVSKFWIMQVSKRELSVASTSKTGIRHHTVLYFGPQFFLYSVGGFGLGEL